MSLHMKTNKERSWKTNSQMSQISEYNIFLFFSSFKNKQNYLFSIADFIRDFRVIDSPRWLLKIGITIMSQKQGI